MLGQKQKYDEKEKHDKLKLDAQKMSEDLADVYKGPTPKTDQQGHVPLTSSPTEKKEISIELNEANTKQETEQQHKSASFSSVLHEIKQCTPDLDHEFSRTASNKRLETSQQNALTLNEMLWARKEKMT